MPPGTNRSIKEIRMIKIEYIAQDLTAPLLTFVVMADTFAQAVILFEEQTALTQDRIWRMSKI